MKRILLMHSVNDTITDSRIWRIQHSPSLQNFDVRHLFPIELTQSERHQMMDPHSLMQEVTARPFDSNSFKIRLRNALTGFSPEFLIVHAGFVFSRFPQELIQELKDIKQSHPLLRLGIENRGRRILEHHGLEADIFEDSAEIDELIQRFF